jgi:hypothetical protein
LIGREADMPQVLALAALGGMLFAGYKALARVAEAMSADLRRSEEEARMRQAEASGSSGGARNLGTLEFDPKSGVYKPTDKA